MTRTLLSRLLMLLPVLFLVSFATFMMTELLPGDPALAILGENATPDQIAVVRNQLGLDEPVATRYLHWAGGALRGDLGESITSNQSVTAAFKERLPVTVQLAVMAQIIALLFAIPVGVWSAWRAGRLFDRASSTLNLAIIGLPPFILGIALVYVFALKWQVFPVTGWSRLSDGVGANLRHALLPAMTLALGEFAVYSQILRNEMTATLGQDFILSARARGMSVSHVLWRESLRPSSFSLVTLAGVNLGRLIGGTVIIEKLFGLGGVGSLVTQAIAQKDFPVLQGSVLILATLYLLINTAVDVGFHMIDPRLRRPGL